jgi:hypothetical protein
VEFDRVSSWGCHLEEAKKLLRHELLCLHLDSTWGLKHGVPSLTQDSKDSIIESTIEDSLKRLSVSLLNFLMQPVKKRPFNIDADVREKTSRPHARLDAVLSPPKKRLPSGKHRWLAGKLRNNSSN